MFNFQELLTKFSNFGFADPNNNIWGQAGIVGSPDADLQRLNETAFRVNQWAANGIIGQTPTNADFANYYINSPEGNAFDKAGSPEDEQAFRDYFNQEGDLQTLIQNSPYNQSQLNAAFNGFNSDVVQPFNTKSGNLEQLAPAIGGLAALQELNMMEGAEQARQQKLNFQNPNNFRQNPTNGLGNFYAEEGGNMHKDTSKMKKNKLPKNFKIPRINLTNTPLDVGDDIQLYRQGGMVTGHTKNFDNKVNTYGLDLKDRFFSGTNRVPVQTESGKKGQEEMIVLPSLDLIKVNADRRHKRMDKDQVTDYVPEGSYILSQFGDVTIKRDEAENLTTEVGIKPYDIFGNNGVPTKKSLADVMTKKEMSPADVAREIKKKFAQIDREDPFTKRTNDENKLNSLPYIQGLVLLSEVDKSRRGIVNELDESYNPPSGATLIEGPQQGTVDELPRFGSGGVVKRKNVAKAIDPITISALIGLGSTLVGGYFDNKNTNRQLEAEERRFQENKKTISDVAERQSFNNQASAGASILGLLAQDTTVEGNDIAFQDYANTLRNQQIGIAQPLLDAQINRGFRNNNSGTIFQNAPSFAAGLQAQTLQNANVIDGMNDLFFQNANQRNSMALNLGQMLANNARDRGFSETTRIMNQKMANNNVMGGVAGATAAAFDTDSTIQANRASNMLAASGQNAAVNLQLNSQRQQTNANVLTGINQFVPQLFPTQAQATTPLNFGTNSFANGTRQLSFINPPAGGPGNCPPGQTWSYLLQTCY